MTHLKNARKGRGLAACMAFFILAPLAVHAQQFSAPSCGNGLADSTCYTAPSPNSCALAPAKISERGACPVGYVGLMEKRGTRDSCNGEVELVASSDESGCTNCGQPLSALEALNIQRAVFEVNESVNQAYVNNVCSGFSCLDGASVNDVAGGQPIGRIFRDHVWVAQDGFSSGYLPTRQPQQLRARVGQAQRARGLVRLDTSGSWRSAERGTHSGIQGALIHLPAASAAGKASAFTLAPLSNGVAARHP